MQVGPPNAEERYEILVIHTSRATLDSDVDLHALSNDTISNFYTGADIEAVVREACLFALRESLTSNCVVNLYFNS